MSQYLCLYLCLRRTCRGNQRGWYVFQSVYPLDQLSRRSCTHQEETSTCLQLGQTGERSSGKTQTQTQTQTQNRHGHRHGHGHGHRHMTSYPHVPSTLPLFDFRLFSYINLSHTLSLQSRPNRQRYPYITSHEPIETPKTSTTRRKKKEQIPVLIQIFFLMRGLCSREYNRPYEKHTKKICSPHIACRSMTVGR